MDRTWYIYALKDPLTNVVRYVGRTFCFDARIRSHQRGDIGSRMRNVPKNKWTRELAAHSMVPAVEVLETGTDQSQCFDAEIRWIAHYRRISGALLLNITKGGLDGGLRSVATPETRAKLSAAGKKAWQNEEVRARMLAKPRGPRGPQSRPRVRRKATPETKVKLRAAMLRRPPLSAESRAKIAATLRGRISPLRGRTLSAETRAKIAQAKKKGTN